MKFIIGHRNTPASQFRTFGSGVWEFLLSVAGELKSHKRLFFSDIFLVAAALSASYILRSGLPLDATHSESITGLVLTGVLTAAVIFPLLGMYRRHPETTSIRDAVIVTTATTLVLLAIGILRSLGLAAVNVPPEVMVIALFVALPFLCGTRLVRRINQNLLGTLLGGGNHLQAATAEPVLLVGTGTACDLFLRAVRNMPNPPYQPIGIVDGVENTRGLVFHDVPIVGSVLDVEAVKDWFATRALPRHIVLTEAPAQFNEDEVRKLVSWAESQGIGVRRLPGICDLHGLNESRPLSIEEVQPNDLLQRPAHVVDRKRLARLVTGRRIVVTGAGGSIGGELVRQIAANHPESLLLIDNCEFNLYSIGQDLDRHFSSVVKNCEICDVRDRTRVENLFMTYRPDIVFHAAALKHVPIVEANPGEGVLTNAIGTRNVADAARHAEAAAMVQISTDKAVNATSVMGATKRVAEFYCGALDREAEREGKGTRFMTVRFGNVLGSSGSLIPLLKEQIASGGPLTVTDPRMERFFMTIREAVELTLMASAHGIEQKTSRGAIFVLDMGEPVRIIDIAERMIRLSGLEPGKDIGIKIIGMRPGEKLFEELFDKLETRAPSGLEGVMVATSAEVSLADAKVWMSRLEAFARLGDSSMIIDTLRQIVPRYRANEGKDAERIAASVVFGAGEAEPGAVNTPGEPTEGARVNLTSMLKPQSGRLLAFPSALEKQ
ncbi:polysaccharide biosynthesis protein [Ruegeria arenilitoris]|uniref:polysaccharide biosynthesis protein n=1 Tax=Ruegeria arenilitoris TaxID=1173585 RepID=UPI00147A7A95